MHKIKQFQIPSEQLYQHDYITNYLLNANPVVKNFMASLQEQQPKMDFKKNTFGANLSITPPVYKGLGSNLLETKKSDGLLATKGNNNNFSDFLKKTGTETLGNVPNVLEAGLKLGGAKEATLQGVGDQVFSQVSSSLWKGALKSGNIFAIGGAGVLKGLDLLNRYAGKTANKQGTDAGLNTGGYATVLSPNAGQKGTLSKNGMINSINKQTKMADRANLLAGAAAYKTNQNKTLAANTFNDVLSKNNQKLYGGLNTGVISAQKGTILTPQRKNIHTNEILPNREVSKAVESPLLLDENLSFIPNFTIKLFDPTGITSWGDVNKAWSDKQFTSDDILQPIGALPLIGRLAKTTELANAQKILSKGKTAYTDTITTGGRKLKKSFKSEYISPFSKEEVRQARNIVNNNKLATTGQLALRAASDYTDINEIKETVKTFIEKNKNEDAKQITKLNSSINPTILEKGGQLTNVIPEGALHARKNNYEGELGEQVTDKGIPVITYEDGNKIIQHAEIENSEIIFNKAASTKLEELFKEYNEAENEAKKKAIEIECGKFLVLEILENTEDNVGLINNIE